MRHTSAMQHPLHGEAALRVPKVLRLPAACCLLPQPLLVHAGGHQQGSTAEVVGLQRRGVIAQAVWRGESLREMVRGSGCQEDSRRWRGVAAGSGGMSELGQQDSQSG